MKAAPRSGGDVIDLAQRREEERARRALGGARGGSEEEPSAHPEAPIEPAEFFRFLATLPEAFAAHVRQAVGHGAPGHYDAHARTRQTSADAAASSAHAMPDLSPIQGMYGGLDNEAVQATLARHPGLVSLLSQAAPHVVEHFGPGATLALQAQPVESGGFRLYAVINASGEWAKLRARLDAFDDAWWLDHIDSHIGPLTFTVGQA